MIASMSLFCVSEKLCAEAAKGIAPDREGEQRGSKQAERGHWQFLLVKAVFSIALVGGRLGSDDIVSLDPSGCADGETCLGARGEIARGLVVATEIGSLCRGEVSVRIISFFGISHSKLGIAQRPPRFPAPGAAFRIVIASAV